MIVRSWIVGPHRSKSDEADDDPIAKGQANCGNRRGDSVRNEASRTRQSGSQSGCWGTYYVYVLLIACISVNKQCIWVFLVFYCPNITEFVVLFAYPPVESNLWQSVVMQV